MPASLMQQADAFPLPFRNPISPPTFHSRETARTATALRVAGHTKTKPTEFCACPERQGCVSTSLSPLFFSYLAWSSLEFRDNPGYRVGRGGGGGAARGGARRPRPAARAI